MNYPDSFDVIVVGGGHAGTEAAMASARTGANTLLLTHAIETLGQMSCNPAIGGIGKGHLVKEIDALGGVMGRAADAAGIHWRTLNGRKGPAVRATRAQIDRALYRVEVRARIEAQADLTLFQQAADDLIVHGDRVHGVVTQMGLCFHAPAVVLTVGTFLGGLIHIGLSNYAGGRAGDPPANRLSSRLRELDLRVERLKTGTPPRLDGRTLDWTVMQRQPGDEPMPSFSYLGSAEQHPEQVSCHITRTNARTHQIIRSGLDTSPMYSGIIGGVGPRYCPSVEDKIMRFADKDNHQIFVEPEGLRTTEVYPNGISTSLGFEVQLALVRSIEGFERAHITRPGYAIEYDYFDPRDLRHSLETRDIAGLFFAGQINGTTGYEEAAAQGLLAGVNAARQVAALPAWTPGRDEAYLGVLVDDLITRGTQEPYRMFTSRAEYRLLLREDNADLRLTAKGRELGLVDDARWAVFNEKYEALERERQRLKDLRVNAPEIDQAALTALLGGAPRAATTVGELLRRPDVDYGQLMAVAGIGPGADRPDVAYQVSVEARYHGYIDRQARDIARNRARAKTRIPDGLDFAQVQGLSSEVTQKLIEYRPGTIAEAERIDGMTPAAISLLLVHLHRRGGRDGAKRHAAQ